MTPTFSRGSEWRKWDLHLHAPGTKLNDQFRSQNNVDVWDAYCQKLHDSDVHAFGITDYFSADCYFAVNREYRKRYQKSSKVFFPNVELRTSYVVNKAHEEVQLHLIFNPFKPNYEERIRYFLGILSINRTDSGDRNVKAAELKTQTDFESATTERDLIQRALIETYGPNAEILDYVIIVTAANNDGIRAQSGAKRKAELTDELDKFSDAFFGNSGNVAHFLRTDRSENKQEKSKQKPVLSGCDAHSLTDLDERLGQVVSSSNGAALEPTWIKANLTYEGLKQIVFEPGNRVFIGPEPEVERRVRQNGTHYIESLHINSIPGYKPQQLGTWFADEKIPLGKELVAIIGNKGSGKSALTDIIGLLGNSQNQMSRSLAGGRSEELFSFLNKEKFLKAGFARNFMGSLNWHVGEPDNKALDEQSATHLPEKVKYLPQKYLERVCTNIADDEFRTTLNEVIFRYVKPQDQHGKSSLDELIDYRTQQAGQDITSKKQDLHQANVEVVRIERKLTDDYRIELEEKIRLKSEEVDAHGNARPAEMPNPKSDSASPSHDAQQVDALSTEIAAISAQIDQIQAEQVSTSAIVESLRQAKQAINRESASLIALKTQFAATFESAGLDFDRVVKVSIDLAALDTSIGQREARLAEIETLLLSTDDVELESVDDESSKISATSASLMLRRFALESRKSEIIERLGKPTRDYQQYLIDLGRWEERGVELRGSEQNPGAETLSGLERELEKVNHEYRSAVTQARYSRQLIAKELFGKKRGLTAFYNAIKHSIDAEIGKCRDDLGEYGISIEAGLRLSPSFFEEFLRFINQSATGSFRGQEEGLSLLRGLTDSVTDWEDETQVFSALEAIVVALHIDRRPSLANAHRDVFKQMKGQKTVQELYDYLFGFKYLETKYDLKIDGKDLSELSPGERGGLLLIFYLMLDQQNTPLVIDQPEDNLDNKSVYEILVKFIKKAKTRRQIILVTHNPNLAVVADAEQLIHVSIDKKDGLHDFDFFSGAIEDRRINEAVVDILEGTLPAFDNRRLKYRRHA